MRQVASLLVVFCVTGVVQQVGVASQTEARPNILWIVGENLKLDLGCYGAKNVRTPNLDNLAARGM